MSENYLHNELTENIIKAFYNVYNTLGYGFLEKVYENALSIELEKNNIKSYKQFPIPVHYETIKVGDYFADLLVENKVIVELKAVEFISVEHEKQLINYLKATKYEVGLVLNFGKKPEIKRKILTNNYKIEM
jgi:GxxExxY protein